MENEYWGRTGIHQYTVHVVNRSQLSRGICYSLNVRFPWSWRMREKQIRCSEWNGNVHTMVLVSFCDSTASIRPTRDEHFIKIKELNHNTLLWFSQKKNKKPNYTMYMVCSTHEAWTSTMHLVLSTGFELPKALKHSWLESKEFLLTNVQGRSLNSSSGDSVDD